MFQFGMIYILAFIVLWDCNAEDKLRCSKNGTSIIYVNDIGMVQLKTERAKSELRKRYVGTSKASLIDNSSKVSIDNLILPTFGSTKDEIAALELEYKALGSENSLINLLRSKKLNIGSMIDYSNISLPNNPGDPIFNIFDYWSFYRYYSDAIELNKAGENFAKIFYSKGQIVKFFNSNIKEQAQERIKKIDNFDKNIFIAHGAGGYYLDAILDEVKFTTPNFLRKYKDYNSVLYLEHKDDSLFHEGNRKAFINLKTRPLTNEVALLTLPGAFLFQSFMDYNPFTDIYLGQVKASTSMGSSSEEYVSSILDQKVFSLAKTLQNNCKPILESRNTRCVPRENGITYTDFEFSLDTENDDRPLKHLFLLGGAFDYLPPNPLDDPNIFDDNLFRSSSSKMSLQLDDGFGLRSDILDVNNPCIPRSSISASVECTSSEYSIQRFKVNYDITSAGSIVVENVGTWETPGVGYNFSKSISVSSNTDILYFDYGIQFPALGDVKISLVPSDSRLSVKSTTVTIPDCRN